MYTIHLVYMRWKSSLAGGGGPDSFNAFTEASGCVLDELDEMDRGH
jgi:hypothetical protein